MLSWTLGVLIISSGIGLSLSTILCNPFLLGQLTVGHWLLCEVVMLSSVTLLEIFLLFLLYVAVSMLLWLLSIFYQLVLLLNRGCPAFFLLVVLQRSSSLPIMCCFLVWPSQLLLLVTYLFLSWFFFLLLLLLFLLLYLQLFLFPPCLLPPLFLVLSWTLCFGTIVLDTSWWTWLGLLWQRTLLLVFSLRALLSVTTVFLVLWVRVHRNPILFAYLW